MAITASILATELQTDTAQLGYAPLIASGSDQAIADLLNAKTRAGRAPVPVTTLLLGAVTSGVLADLMAASTNLTLPKAARTAALALLRLLDRSDQIDLDNPSFRAVLDGLVTAGVLTATQRDAVLALGNAAVSRAEQLFGPGMTVSHLDVARALGRG